MKLKKSCSLFKVFQLMYRKNGFIKISMLTLLIREALILTRLFHCRLQLRLDLNWLFVQWSKSLWQIQSAHRCTMLKIVLTSCLCFYYKNNLFHSKEDITNLFVYSLNKCSSKGGIWRWERFKCTKRRASKTRSPAEWWYDGPF